MQINTGEKDDCVKQILEAYIRGQQSRRRQRKRRIDAFKYNLENLRLNL